MPAEGSDEVADDYVATETPADGSEVAGEAEGVEENLPPTAEPVAEESRNWADLSEGSLAPAPSEEPALTQVKEEVQEAESLNAVLSAIGVPEVVADDPVATEGEFEHSTSDQTFLAAPTDLDNPAEAAFTDLDQAKEEDVQPDLQESPSEHVDVGVEEADHQAETTDLLGLGEEAGPVGEASVASEPSASVPEPAVADTAGVATEANTTCPGEIVPPPTSPNLVEPGTDPIQVGHSPATSSNPPRQRVRSSRGGAQTRWQEAKRAWWNDFEAYQNWLYHNSGGDIVGGFWLRKISYEQADESTRWLIALHSRLVEKFTTSQCLTLAYNILLPYKEWAHYYGLDRRRGTAHAQQVIDSGELPPKRIINQRILGAEHPRPEEWDVYYRYIGPQQQPRPKVVRPAAATPVAGAASGSADPTPVQQGPKEPGHPPPNWQPSLRAPNHPVQPPRPRVTVSVHPVPKAPKSDSQGVAASGRDVAPVPVACPARPPPKARPKAPDSSATTLADRIRGLPPPPNTIAPSPTPHKQPPLPPPATPPPGDNFPPPPSHPPPTAEELAARSSRRAEAREEVAPADPNDPPQEEQEWVAEEAEEEEVLEEDEVVEVEVEAEAEPEFPDFTTTERGREISTRRRRPKRNRSDPPLPVNLVPRETRERIELNREIYRARSITGVSRRPLALRPQVHGYPEIRIDSAGTWARVADPPIAYAPQTLPFIIPHAEAPELGVNPHELPDSLWRDPALRSHRTVLGSSNLDPNSVYNIATNNPDTESEGSETAETRTARFVSSAEAFVGQQEPVDAGFAERTPARPIESPPKRQRPNIRTSRIQRDKPAQPRKDSVSAAPPPPAAPTVPSLTVPPLSSSSSSAYPPWRQSLQSAGSGVADTARVATETASEPAGSPAARSRSRAPSADTAPAVAAKTNRGREIPISNKISSKSRKRASSVPVPRRAKGAAVPDTPQRPEPLPPAPEPKRKDLPWKQPPVVVPPRPNRPVPPNPANLKPVKPPPPGIERARPAGPPSRDLPPLDPEGQQQQQQEQSSGSGLAPHIRGRPLPEPNPDRPEGVAGTIPRHYQHQPNLVSKVVHVSASNIVVCIDWHDTIDQALNPIGELSSRLVEKLRLLTRAAGNQIEFHIISYAGASKVESTRAGAEHVISQLIAEGLPFRELHLARHPCGRQGKASVISALQAHCLVDDRSDIINECSQLGIKTIRSEGRSDKELCWIAEIEDWIRLEGIKYILHARRPIQLRADQFYPPFGGQDDRSLW